MSVFQKRCITEHLPLRLLETRPVGALVNLSEEVSLVDDLTLISGHLRQITADLRSHSDCRERRHRSQGLQDNGHVLPQHCCNRNARNRPAFGLLVLRIRVLPEEHDQLRKCDQHDEGNTRPASAGTSRAHRLTGSLYLRAAFMHESFPQTLMVHPNPRLEDILCRGVSCRCHSRLNVSSWTHGLSVRGVRAQGHASRPPPYLQVLCTIKYNAVSASQQACLM